jgi:ABC-type multidrug transport system ATPase subunit
MIEARGISKYYGSKPILEHVDLFIGKGDRIGGILEKLSLSRYRYENPRDLSTGEKERAALATVLVAGQRIILLDEPTRGMDAEKIAVERIA